jgi:hypothetical protein
MALGMKMKRARAFGIGSATCHTGCNVEVYAKDTCLALETHGCLTKSNPNESVTLEGPWEIFTDTEYPATIESARVISAQLSKIIGVHNGKQNFFSKRFPVGFGNGFVPDRRRVE